MPGVRQPAVAGQFYEGRREGLEESLERCFRHPLGPGDVPQMNLDGPGAISALVSPHAGYMFSGPAAAHAYHALATDGVPNVVIILGPSHYAAARTNAVSSVEYWRTPLGDVEVDAELGRELIKATALLEEDENVHRDEHSLEVQVPFLQFIYKEHTPSIVPICIRSHPRGDIDPITVDAVALGETMAEVLGSRRAVVIASTDFSHQVPHDTAERQDRLAMDAIEALDPAGLLRTVSRHGISMCGSVPVAVALSYCLAKGPHKAELLRYYTSGDIIGDRRAVVGYASFVIRHRGD